MVKTVTVTKYAQVGLYEGRVGINTIFLPYKTNRFARGGVYYPDCLEETKDNGIELPFSDYCQKLRAAGVNLLRVKWSGQNAPDGDGYHGIEPPPYGTYNLWGSVLDPDDLATYRSNQSTIPLGIAEWINSNLCQFVMQCHNYGINLHVLIFEASEFQPYKWQYNAWNSNNYYTNGIACQAADQGFIANAYEFFTDATAIQAAKDRIDFILGSIQGISVGKWAISSWELFAEMSWVLRPEFWGEPSWNANMVANIRDKVNPWVSEIASYLRAQDPYKRPIAMGLLRPPVLGAWPVDPDHYNNVVNEPMVQFPVDICCINLYEDTFAECVRTFRLAKAYAGDKLVWATQFSPIQFDGPSAEEPSPFSESKQRLWIGVCGERWGLTPIRWPGLKRSGDNEWMTGGYADADFYSIPGIVNTFCANVDWLHWKSTHEVFDAYITSASGTDNFVSYGDGENVTMMIDFSSGGTKTINVTNLADGTYTFTYYNWPDGAVDGTLAPVAAGGSLSMDLSVSGYSDNMIVAHLIKN